MIATNLIRDHWRKAERERRFWGTMVEVSQRNGQEGRSADPLQLGRDQLFQGFAKRQLVTMPRREVAARRDDCDLSTGLLFSRK